MPTTEAERADPTAPLETARLTLRPLLRSDAAAITAFSNDRAVLRNLSFLPYPLTVVETERWIDDQPALRLWLVAVERDGGRPIGVSGIHPDADGGAEIGYWLGRAHWGRGYATEIARAVAGMARDRGHDPVWALVLPDNAGSVRVLQKTGFIREGEARKWFLSRQADMPLHRYRLERAGP